MGLANSQQRHYHGWRGDRFLISLFSLFQHTDLEFRNQLVLTSSNEVILAIYPNVGFYMLLTLL